MPKFIVTMREVHYQDVLVTAKNEKAAIAAAAEGQGDFVNRRRSLRIPLTRTAVRLAGLASGK